MYANTPGTPQPYWGASSTASSHFMSPLNQSTDNGRLCLFAQLCGCVVCGIVVLVLGNTPFDGTLNNHTAGLGSDIICL